MPFIQQKQIAEKQPLIYTITAVVPHVGVSFVIQKWAEELATQNENVLIFDALLGLKNFPHTNPNTDKIPDVINGWLPLTDLIHSLSKKIDVVTGISSQNINALSPFNQQRLINDLITLSTHYDVVFIDCPAAVTTALFRNLGKTVWVSTPDQEALIKTLRTLSAHTHPSLILNKIKNEMQYNDLSLFIKTLLPEGQLLKFFEEIPPKNLTFS